MAIATVFHASSNGVSEACVLPRPPSVNPWPDVCIEPRSTRRPCPPRFSGCFSVLCSPNTRAMPPDEARAWREDLRFMAREMERTHKNLYHTISREQFASAVAALDERIPTLERHEVIVEMAKIVAAVGDGHTNIYPTRDAKIGFHTLPVAFTFFGDELYVRAAHESQRSLVGARVLRIGDRDVLRSLCRREADDRARQRAGRPLLGAVPARDARSAARVPYHAHARRGSADVDDGPRPRGDIAARAWSCGNHERRHRDAVQSPRGLDRRARRCRASRIRPGCAARSTRSISSAWARCSTCRSTPSRTRPRRRSRNSPRACTTRSRPPNPRRSPSICGSIAAATAC